MFSCFMHDCLTHLSNLSASMQRPSLTVAEVQTSLIATQAVLNTRTAPRHDLSLARVNSTKDKLIDTFCSSMATRFSDFSSGVLHASKLVDIMSWPDADKCEDCGDAYVECLIKHFGPLLASSGAHLDLIPDQWTFLKNSLYQQHPNMDQLTWPEINQRLGGQCPDFLQLVHVLLCIPASTADCERGFNLMKQVKSDWRSGLRPDTLSGLSSPDIEHFDPDSAIHLWHQASIRERRTDFMEREAKKRTTQLEDEQETSEKEDDDSEED
ncbi:hypothetical protein DPEC_G00219560 [Dallia pectoralis]|uniref:Uncharacterized protein n=1 Tax=Dallia pectoralis TaxID=75939 RepID=A0ACC2G3N8_DALPE|nr:hypothetical protein DPEC_G00219560 [Dallia pectoralis]